METPNVVGFRFSPTVQELIIYYLMNKILGKSWLVDEAIMEINICDFEPEFLPSLSKIKSKDLVWYFFSLLSTKKNGKKMLTKRTTPSGFWKPTGQDRKIKDTGGNGAEIGIKKTLVHYKGKSATGVRTPWVMHEYHVTSKLLNDQRPYVICQVMYKGKDVDSFYGNNSNELSQSNVSDWINTPPEVGQLDQQDNSRLSLDDLLTPTNQQQALSSFDRDVVFSNSNNNPYVQPQSPGDDECISDFLLEFNGGSFEDVIPSQEFTQHTYYNNHTPKKPSTGTIPYYSDTDDSSSDSDAESISVTSYQRISSPGDSDGSSTVDEIPSLSIDSCKDVKPSAETSINRKTNESHFTRRTAPSKQEVKEGKSKAVDASMDKKSSSSMVKTEKFITEEAMHRNRKNPPYVHFMNMIIDFVNLVGGGCH